MHLQSFLSSITPSPLFRGATVPFSGNVAEGNVSTNGTVLSSVDVLSDSRAVGNALVFATELLIR